MKLNDAIKRYGEIALEVKELNEERKELRAIIFNEFKYDTTYEFEDKVMRFEWYYIVKFDKDRLYEVCPSDLIKQFTYTTAHFKITVRDNKNQSQLESEFEQYQQLKKKFEGDE